MKTLLSILFSAFMALGMGSSSNPISKDGTYKGKKLAGCVRIVEHNANFKVKVVEYNPNLRVKIVDSFADNPGEWRLVKHNADFTIQFVEHNADFTIQYVESFPGVQ